MVVLLLLPGLCCCQVGLRRVLHILFKPTGAHACMQTPAALLLLVLRSTQTCLWLRRRG